VRQTFNDSLQAREWEHKVIDKLNLCSSSKWLNKGNGQPPPFAWNKGLTKKTDERLKNANYNPWHSGLTKKTDERIMKYSELMKGRPSPNKGKIFDDEWRQNLSSSHIGNTHSDETRNKMSKTRKGRKHSEEHSKAISESHKGVPLSEKHKEGLRRGWIKRKQKMENIK